MHSSTSKSSSKSTPRVSKSRKLKPKRRITTITQCIKPSKIQTSSILHSNSQSISSNASHIAQTSSPLSNFASNSSSITSRHLTFLKKKPIHITHHLFSTTSSQHSSQHIASPNDHMDGTPDVTTFNPESTQPQGYGKSTVDNAPQTMQDIQHRRTLIEPVNHNLKLIHLTMPKGLSESPLIQHPTQKNESFGPKLHDLNPDEIQPSLMTPFLSANFTLNQYGQSPLIESVLNNDFARFHQLISHDIHQHCNSIAAKIHQNPRVNHPLKDILYSADSTPENPSFAVRYMLSFRDNDGADPLFYSLTRDDNTFLRHLLASGAYPSYEYIVPDDEIQDGQNSAFEHLDESKLVKQDDNGNAVLKPALHVHTLLSLVTSMRKHTDAQLLLFSGVNPNQILSCYPKEMMAGYVQLCLEQVNNFNQESTLFKLAQQLEIDKHPSLRDPKLMVSIEHHLKGQEFFANHLRVAERYLEKTTRFLSLPANTYNFTPLLKKQNEFIDAAAKKGQPLQQLFQTPLAHAVNNKDTEMVQILAKHGADVQLSSYLHRASLLEIAVYLNDPLMLTTLLDNLASLADHRYLSGLEVKEQQRRNGENVLNANLENLDINSMQPDSLLLNKLTPNRNGVQYPYAQDKNGIIIDYAFNSLLSRLFPRPHRLTSFDALRDSNDVGSFRGDLEQAYPVDFIDDMNKVIYLDPWKENTPKFQNVLRCEPFKWNLLNEHYLITEKELYEEHRQVLQSEGLDLSKTISKNVFVHAHTLSPIGFKRSQLSKLEHLALIGKPVFDHVVEEALTALELKLGIEDAFSIDSAESPDSLQEIADLMEKQQSLSPKDPQYKTIEEKLQTLLIKGHEDKKQQISEQRKEERDANEALALLKNEDTNTSRLNVEDRLDHHQEVTDQPFIKRSKVSPFYNDNKILINNQVYHVVNGYPPSWKYHIARYQSDQLNTQIKQEELKLLESSGFNFKSLKSKPKLFASPDDPTKPVTGEELYEMNPNTQIVRQFEQKLQDAKKKKDIELFHQYQSAQRIYIAHHKWATAVQNVLVRLFQNLTSKPSQAQITDGVSQDDGLAQETSQIAKKLNKILSVEDQHPTQGSVLIPLSPYTQLESGLYQYVDFNREGDDDDQDGKEKSISNPTSFATSLAPYLQPRLKKNRFTREQYTNPPQQSFVLDALRPFMERQMLEAVNMGYMFSEIDKGASAFLKTDDNNPTLEMNDPAVKDQNDFIRFFKIKMALEDLFNPVIYGKLLHKFPDLADIYFYSPKSPDGFLGQGRMNTPAGQHIISQFNPLQLELEQTQREQGITDKISELSILPVSDIQKFINIKISKYSYAQQQELQHKVLEYIFFLNNERIENWKVNEKKVLKRIFDHIAEHGEDETAAKLNLQDIMQSFTTQPPIIDPDTGADISPLGLNEVFFTFNPFEIDEREDSPQAKASGDDSAQKHHKFVPQKKSLEGDNKMKSELINPTTNPFWSQLPSLASLYSPTHFNDFYSQIQDMGIYTGSSQSKFKRKIKDKEEPQSNELIDPLDQLTQLAQEHPIISSSPIFALIQRYPKLAKKSTENNLAYKFRIEKVLEDLQAGVFTLAEGSNGIFDTISSSRLPSTTKEESIFLQKLGKSPLKVVTPETFHNTLHVPQEVPLIQRTQLAPSTYYHYYIKKRPHVPAILSHLLDFDRLYQLSSHCTSVDSQLILGHYCGGVQIPPNSTSLVSDLQLIGDNLKPTNFKKIQSIQTDFQQQIKRLGMDADGYTQMMSDKSIEEMSKLNPSEFLNSLTEMYEQTMASRQNPRLDGTITKLDHHSRLSTFLETYKKVFSEIMTTPEDQLAPEFKGQIDPEARINYQEIVSVLDGYITSLKPIEAARYGESDDIQMRNVIFSLDPETGEKVPVKKKSIHEIEYDDNGEPIITEDNFILFDRGERERELTTMTHKLLERIPVRTRELVLELERLQNQPMRYLNIEQKNESIDRIDAIMEEIHTLKLRRRLVTLYGHQYLDDFDAGHIDEDSLDLIAIFKDWRVSFSEPEEIPREDLTLDQLQLLDDVERGRRAQSRKLIPTKDLPFSKYEHVLKYGPSFLENGFVEMETSGDSEIDEILANEQSSEENNISIQSQVYLNKLQNAMEKGDTYENLMDNLKADSDIKQSIVSYNDRIQKRMTCCKSLGIPVAFINGLELTPEKELFLDFILQHHHRLHTIRAEKRKMVKYYMTHWDFDLQTVADRFPDLQMSSTDDYSVLPTLFIPDSELDQNKVQSKTNHLNKHKLIYDEFSRYADETALQFRDGEQNIEKMLAQFQEAHLIKNGKTIGDKGSQNPVDLEAILKEQGIESFFLGANRDIPADISKIKDPMVILAVGIKTHPDYPKFQQQFDDIKNNRVHRSPEEIDQLLKDFHEFSNRVEFQLRHDGVIPFEITNEQKIADAKLKAFVKVLAKLKQRNQHALDITPIIGTNDDEIEPDSTSPASQTDTKQKQSKPKSLMIPRTKEQMRKSDQDHFKTLIGDISKATDSTLSLQSQQNVNSELQETPKLPGIDLKPSRMTFTKNAPLQERILGMFAKLTEFDRSSSQYKQHAHELALLLRESSLQSEPNQDNPLIGDFYGPITMNDVIEAFETNILGLRSKDQLLAQLYDEQSNGLNEIPDQLRPILDPQWKERDQLMFPDIENPFTRVLDDFENEFKLQDEYTEDEDGVKHDDDEETINLNIETDIFYTQVILYPSEQALRNHLLKHGPNDAVLQLVNKKYQLSKIYQENIDDFELDFDQVLSPHVPDFHPNPKLPDLVPEPASNHQDNRLFKDMSPIEVQSYLSTLASVTESDHARSILDMIESKYDADFTTWSNQYKEKYDKHIQQYILYSPSAFRTEQDHIPPPPDRLTYFSHMLLREYRAYSGISVQMKRQFENKHYQPYRDAIKEQQKVIELETIGTGSPLEFTFDASIDVNSNEDIESNLVIPSKGKIHHSKSIFNFAQQLASTITRKSILPSDDENDLDNILSMRYDLDAALAEGLSLEEVNTDDDTEDWLNVLEIEDTIRITPTYQTYTELSFKSTQLHAQFHAFRQQLKQSTGYRGRQLNLVTKLFEKRLFNIPDEVYTMIDHQQADDIAKQYERRTQDQFNHSSTPSTTTNNAQYVSNEEQDNLNFVDAQIISPNTSISTSDSSSKSHKPHKLQRVEKSDVKLFSDTALRLHMDDEPVSARLNDFTALGTSQNNSTKAQSNPNDSLDDTALEAMAEAQINDLTLLDFEEIKQANKISPVYTTEELDQLFQIILSNQSRRTNNQSTNLSTTPRSGPNTSRHRPYQPPRPQFDTPSGKDTRSAEEIARDQLEDPEMDTVVDQFAELFGGYEQMIQAVSDELNVPTLQLVDDPDTLLNGLNTVCKKRFNTSIFDEEAEPDEEEIDDPEKEAISMQPSDFKPPSTPITPRERKLFARYMHMNEAEGELATEMRSKAIDVTFPDPIERQSSAHAEDQFYYYNKDPQSSQIVLDQLRDVNLVQLEKVEKTRDEIATFLKDTDKNRFTEEQMKLDDVADGSLKPYPLSYDKRYVRGNQRKRTKILGRDDV